VAIRNRFYNETCLAAKEFPMTPARLLAATLLAATLAAPALARDAAPYYRAELAAPAAEARIVAGGLLWRCEGTQCFAGKDNSRPLIVCRKLAREAAPVTRFTAADEELAVEDLARCNG
jgi:hypothetical protein